MPQQPASGRKTKTFLDIPSAARLAGFSAPFPQNH